MIYLELRDSASSQALLGLLIWEGWLFLTKGKMGEFQKYSSVCEFMVV